MYRRIFKRSMDIVLSLLALLILSPVLLVIAVIVRIKLGGPIFFLQDRPGKNEKVFKMYKFRTMTNDRDGDGKLLPDELRLTRFGKILRSTSLDELPELWNILKGDMSIVGPRPLLIKYLPLYNSEQRRRHEVRPGLTGLAQVSGRNAISWEDRFQLDVQYIDQMSFINDIKIILRTVKKVLFKEGISSETSVTMEVFEGTKEDSIQ